MKAYIKTYGCTLNQADGDIIKSQLLASGIDVAASEADADVVVLNTCTVKEQTQIRIVQKMHSLGASGKKLVVTGCMASANPDIVRKHAPHASIASIHNIGSFAHVVSEAAAGSRLEMLSQKQFDRVSLYRPGGGAIARIPVNDGCLSSCAFCETKRARGKLNSFSEESIIKAVQLSAAKGAKEIEITSQDIGAYGKDRGTSIIELMYKISKLDGDFMVRIGMMNPEHLSHYIDDFISALSDRKFYKFAHIPIQSGSERVLSLMGRNGCTPSEFADIVSRMRKAFPDMSIETDIIVGFPGETEADFDKTIELLKQARPDVTNVSRFTKRPHARASKMVQLPPKEINSRSIEASRTVREIQAEINSRFVGRDMELLATEKGDGFNVCRDVNYRHAIIHSGSIQVGTKLFARAVSSSSYSIICEPY
ncbi:MAG: tRNA (N(6)-L-threonylcarbamoyladenosine(37)-C(2))-methylthiotransferase [Candidatus Micrarchaeaceae archaeon]